jgi:glycosyltransferase involved in cell wall biosynthesis
VKASNSTIQIDENLAYNRIRLSIVASAYSFDRYNDLIDLLNGIKEQTYKEGEAIIVIDQNKELYGKISEYILLNNLHGIKLVFNSENRGLSYSRNIGVTHATGDIIAFIDDDAIPYPEWAEEILNTFNDDEIGAVTGDVIPLWEYKEMSWFPKELHWMISCSYIMTPHKKEEVERGFGTNMAFRKDLLYKVGMFDTNLGIKINNWVGGEDTDMFLSIKEIGKKVIFNPDAKVLHKVYAYRIGTKNIIKRAFNGGMSVAIMKNIRLYNIKRSTEHNYLKKIFFEFYPDAFKGLTMKSSVTSLKQIVIVSIVIMFEGLGYFYRIVIPTKFDKRTN